MSKLQKIAEIESEMARTQKNKATEQHLGLLKARLARLKREVLMPSSGSGAGKGEGFDVAKSGDSRVGFIGFPSVGKSTLLTKLTGTESESADYEFTTLTCIPGSLQYKGCKIQLLDLPGIIEGAKDGKGRGRQVIGIARTCDLILIVLDAAKPLTHKNLIEHELEGFGIRLNKQHPDISFKKKSKGGITVTKTVPLTHLDDKQIMSICKEFRIISGEFIFRCDATVDDLIDVIEANRVYIPCLYVLNKIDQITIEELDILDKIPHVVPISAFHEQNFDELLDTIQRYLDMNRIYTKPKGQIPDYDEPIVLPKSRSTIKELCLRIHKSLVEDFKYALVQGSSVKHNPQKCGKEHQCEDEDVVQIVKKT